MSKTSADLSLIYKSMDYREPEVRVYYEDIDGQEQRHDLNDYDVIAWVHRHLGNLERDGLVVKWETNEIWQVQSWEIRKD